MSCMSLLDVSISHGSNPHGTFDQVWKEYTSLSTGDSVTRSQSHIKMKARTRSS